MHQYQRKFEPLNILGQEQFEMIHRGTLQILENTGVVFQSRRALAVLEKGGCRVDPDTGMVTFPPALVEDCLDQCPDTFEIKARDPRNDLAFNENALFFYNSFYEDACTAAFRYAEAGFPFFIVSGIGYGGTGPATIAGSSVTNNAELIAGIVLVQLLNPGTRIVVADFSFPVDMKTGGPCFGNIASGLHAAAFCQTWRKYKIPTCVCSSGYSNSKKCDHQIGSEKTSSALIAALAGANVVSLHGGIYAEMSYHPVQSILDDDIAGMIGRFIQGVDVTEDTMALDLIKAVGSAPGHYLDKRHTFDWWRHDRYSPNVADDLNYDKWMKSGKKDSLAYSQEKMERILAQHGPMPLTEVQQVEIDRILEDARKYYQGKGVL